MRTIEAESKVVEHSEFKVRLKEFKKIRKSKSAEAVRLIIGHPRFLDSLRSFLEEDDGGFFRVRNEVPKAQVIKLKDLRRKPVA